MIRPVPGPRVPALVALALLLAGAGPAFALGVSVTTEALTGDPGEPLTVGDRVAVTIAVTGDRSEVSGEPRFPAWTGSWGEAEIVDAGPVEPAFGVSGEDGRPRLFAQRLVLTAFRTGEVSLPPREIAVPGPEGTATLTTPAGLSLTVASVLPEEAADLEADEISLKPPAPPESLPLGAPFWISLASGGALLLGLLLLARRGRAAGGSTAATPEDELAAALRAAAEAAERGEPEAGHVQLSLGLRRFLGRAFGFRAVESTTSEVRRRLRERGAPSSVETRVHQVLQACDRVKFARERTGREALEGRIEAAREIAREVDRHLRPPAEGSAQDRKRAA